MSLLTVLINNMKNKHAQQLGRLGGIVKSEAKTKAAQENGKKGGRPTNRIAGIGIDRTINIKMVDLVKKSLKQS